MKSILISLILGVSLAGCGATQITQHGTKDITRMAQNNDRRALTEACAPRKFWKNADAETCVGSAYREGVRDGLWDSAPDKKSRAAAP